MRSRTLSRRRSTLALTITTLVLVTGLAVVALNANAIPDEVETVTVPEEVRAMGWKGVDKLVSEQKLQAAITLVGEILGEARAGGDVDEWTRALVEATKMRIALHGYETAVRFLKDEPWPDDPGARAILDLYYARSLVIYSQSYSWEIRQRERVASTDEVDLKAWTMDRIVEEANVAFGRVWSEREQWGTASLGEYARYIDQNSFPARIRGTLRDAVTYLWVELLGDTSLWRPAHSNELFRLDVPALVAGDSDAGVDTSDPREHPLVKIGYVLDDLEAWHEGGNRPEAALEARLERLRRLWSSLSAEDDRELIIEDLRARLAGFDRSLAWWSMGQGQLADLVRSTDAPDALVRAREIAMAGLEAHPDSLGGQRCRAIVAAIEASSYSIQAMAADGLRRRSIQIQHANLDRVHLRAYRLDLERLVDKARDYNLFPDHRDVPGIVKARTPDAEWTVDLPPTPDFRSHVTFATPPLHDPGAYLVVASLRADFAQHDNHMHSVAMVVGDLVLLSRQVEDGWEVTVRSGASGRRVHGATVRLYRYDWQRGHHLVETRPTGADGLVRFEHQGWGHHQHFLLARLGDELAIDQSYMGRHQEYPRGEQVATFIYTDRSVYRPLQQIHWKVVAYRGGGEDLRFATLPGATTEMRLLDANGDEVAAADVTTNDFGSASGSFDIPSGRLLGAWRLVASIGGETALRVEEYKRPTFEVTVADAAEPVRLNRPATFTGDVRYYFGLPVSSGALSWRVTREPVYPRWWSWWWPPAVTRAQVIATGETTVDAGGAWAVTFTPEADEREASRGVTYRFRLSVDATDEGGETRSASRVFRLGFVSVEARVDSNVGFFRAGEPVELSIQRSDLDGQPRAGAGEWRLVALAQPDKVLLPADQPQPQPPTDATEAEPYRTDGDRLRPRWSHGYDPEAIMARWDEGAEQAHGQVEHGEGGTATVTVHGLEPGAYRLVYTTEDDFGVTCRASRDLIVAGKRGAPVALPFLFLAEKSSLQVGDTARLLLHSALANQEMVLELFRDGRRISRQVVVSGHGAPLVEIPVGEGDRGGFGILVSALRDHQLMTGSRSVFVPWDDRELHLELSTFRDRLRPGTHETFQVTVRGASGETVTRGAAEVLAYMYDRSLDLFAPHTPPRPISLYPFRGNPGSVRASLGQAPSTWTFRDLPGLPSAPRLRGDRLKAIDGYGIGGPGRRMRLGFAEMKSMAAPAPMAARDDAAQAVFAEVAELSEEEATAGAPVVAAEEPPAAELRSDFSETAFFEPHLLTGDDGSVTIEFQVPDSVTEWNVWAHAITRDLRSGSLQQQTRSVKELMVRPYLPRFLREGDRAVLKVVVNNAGDEELSGVLDLEILDPDSETSVLDAFGLTPGQAMGVPFTVSPGGGANLSFPLHAPTRVGQVAFKVTARAGDYSDGELRPLPVLPGRMHLIQSRFVTLRDADRRELHFADMAADDDPTLIHDQLVVSVDAQLFYSVLNALPYLVSYPYECTEQTLNRFLSTGIVASLYDDYPAVARMAEKMSERDTRLETWDAIDPNRKMALEETPWLVTSRGGDEAADDLVNVLDPRVSRAERDSALAKLRKAQTSIGAFPWWPGGPPSPYMTLYILYGFSNGLELEVDVPRDVIIRAWSYLHRHYVGELVQLMMRDDCCWELITFLNFTLSSYPDASWTGGVFTHDDRQQMLDFSFSHWKQHSPLLKGYLALTLERAGRHGDGELVFDSVMDSARTTRDEGAFWAPEDRAWLWYNDTIETHAFALRTLTELDPDDDRRHGLVHWLLLNKKLSHWKSTRATAEVLYSLTHYLEHEGALGQREDATVTIGPIRRDFIFEPDEYTGARNRVLVPGDEVDPETMSTIVVEKQARGFAFASATWHFSTERLPDEARGDLFAVTRTYYKRSGAGDEMVLEPLADGADLEPGDQVEVQLSIRARHAAEYVHLRDPRGAGLEPESTDSRFRWRLGLGYYEEIRDSGTNFFFEWLPAGEYTFSYRLRANMAGTFKIAPATLQSMYAPEFAAYSAGNIVTIAAIQ